MFPFFYNPLKSSLENATERLFLEIAFSHSNKFLKEFSITISIFLNTFILGDAIMDIMTGEK